MWSELLHCSTSELKDSTGAQAFSDVQTVQGGPDSRFGPTLLFSGPLYSWSTVVSGPSPVRPLRARPRRAPGRLLPLLTPRLHLAVIHLKG